MDWYAAIGFSLIIVFSVLQTIQIWKRQSIKDVSGIGCASRWFAVILMFISSCIAGYLPWVIGNGILLISDSILLFCYITIYFNDKESKDTSGVE